MLFQFYFNICPVIAASVLGWRTYCPKSPSPTCREHIHMQEQ